MSKMATCMGCNRQVYQVDGKWSHTPGTVLGCPEKRWPRTPDGTMIVIPEGAVTDGSAVRLPDGSTELESWAMGVRRRFPSSADELMGTPEPEPEELPSAIQAEIDARLDEVARLKSEYGDHAATVDRPVHYDLPGGLQVIDVIEALDLGFSVGNALKYLLRAGRKGPDTVEDLKKAMWYLRRHVERLEREQVANNIGDVGR